MTTKQGQADYNKAGAKILQQGRGQNITTNCVQNTTNRRGTLYYNKVGAKKYYNKARAKILQQGEGPKCYNKILQQGEGPKYFNKTGAEILQQSGGQHITTKRGPKYYNKAGAKILQSAINNVLDDRPCPGRSTMSWSINNVTVDPQWLGRPTTS